MLRYWGTSYLKHQFVNQSVLHSFTHFFFQLQLLELHASNFLLCIDDYMKINIGTKEDDFVLIFSVYF